MGSAPDRWKILHASRLSVGEFGHRCPTHDPTIGTESFRYLFVNSMGNVFLNATCGRSPTVGQQSPVD
jgi:hypothetical protein